LSTTLHGLTVEPSWRAVLLSQASRDHTVGTLVIGLPS
jgi:hypothetical protein